MKKCLTLHDKCNIMFYKEMRRKIWSKNINVVIVGILIYFTRKPIANFYGMNTDIAVKHTK